MNSTPTLSTDRLTLRSPQAGDFPAYAAFFASERSTHEAGPLGRAAARKEIASAVGLATFVSDVTPLNTRSIRLAERLGAWLDPDAPQSEDNPFLVYRHPGPEVRQ